MCCDSSPAAPQAADNTFTDQLASDASANQQHAESEFWPLQSQLTKQVQQWNSPQYAQQLEGQASGSVAQGFAQARANTTAQMDAEGVDPGSGRALSMQRGLAIAQGGDTAAAVTQARQQAAMTGFNALSSVSGMGNANLQIAGSEAGAGANAENQNIALQEQQENINNQGMAGIGQLGGMLGAAYMLAPSSKKLKQAPVNDGDADDAGDGATSEDMDAQQGVDGTPAVTVGTPPSRPTPFRNGLAAVRKMPVKSWSYKPNVMARGLAGTSPGNHIGPMAEDFRSATGVGDGKTIHVGDAIGTTMAAVKELDRKVSNMGART